MSLINHHEFLDMCKMYKWNQVIKIAKENPELLNNTINNRWPPLKQALYYNLYKIIEDNDFDDKIISELLILGANPNYNHNDISILNWIKMKQDKLNKIINILENCYINNNTESNNKCIINIPSGLNNNAQFSKNVSLSLIM